MNAINSSPLNGAPLVEDGSLDYLPLDAISAEDGFNPRKFFQDAAFEELVQAVRAEGVIQPIVVRPSDIEGKYILIAGERRYRASVQAGCEDIPAVIRLVDDRKAAVIALMENATRADLSITEEADAVRIVLTHSGNDKDEAAKKLGWSRQKLDQRLALLHAHPLVKQALTEQTIKLGHAVLLCQLTDAMQETTLASIVNDNISVADLKARLSGFALELSSACFDTKDCQSCPRNSSIQTSLFEDALSGGKCADHECFGTKTNEALLLKKEELAETYHVVFLDTERDPNTYTEVSKTGTYGVGSEQYEKGCKGCANFGGLLSSKAGCVGAVTNDLCFDLTCHGEKVTAYKDCREITVNTGVEEETTPSDDKTAKPSKTGNKPAPKKPTASAAMPKRVSEKIDAFYQRTAEQAALKDVNASLSLALYTVLEKVNKKEDFIVDTIKDKWSKTIERPAALKLLYGCTVDELKLMLVQAASHLPNLESESFPNRDGLVATSKVLLTLTKTDCSEHFLLDKSFVEVHTKGGIEILLKEAKNSNGAVFVTEYEAKHGEGSFKSLLKMKHKELVEKAFKFGFDFTGFVPTCISKNLLDTKSK